VKLLVEQNDRDLKLAQFHYDRSAGETSALIDYPSAAAGFASCLLPFSSLFEW
jgi:hypothetical protein